MYVDRPNARAFLKLREPEKVEALIPDYIERTNWRGHNLAVELNPTTCRVLNRIGIRVPAPIRWEYDWPRPRDIKEPFAHQIVTSEFLTYTRAGFVLNEMGTAKTASVLWAADYLMQRGEVKRAIIAAPLSTLERVWRDEIFRFIMHRTAVVLHGSAERRRELLGAQVDFYIVNYEGLEILAPDLKKRPDIDLFVVDEAAAYRNGDTERYKTLTAILPEKPRLWLLTGTPCPQAATDAWSLARLVNKAKVPQYFSTWKQQVMSRQSQHVWRNRKDWKEKVFAALQPAVRFAKKDCLDLPPVTFESRDVDMTPEQKKAFRMMQQHMVAYAQEYEIDAVNAADQINKLRQILCGAVKDPNGKDYIILPHKPRLNVLLECIEQAAAKTLVIVPFKGITRALHDEVSRHYSTVVVNGDVSATERNKIWARFKNEPDPQVALCHPKVMAHGLTLTEADMMVFYGPIYSNEESQQVMERMNRPGQRLPMTIVRMGAAALEWQIYAQVEGRRMDQESILDLYQTVLQQDV